MRVSKPEIQELPRLQDRCSFVYLERCTINVAGGAIIALREGQRISIPSCSIATVIIGPGVSITTDAIRLLAQGSTPAVWMSADGTRFYAYGKSMAESSKWLIKQAKIVSQEHLRLSAAKIMYGWRFNDDVSSLNMAQLRSIEGRRMRDLYKRFAEEHGTKWVGRLPRIEIQNDDENVNYAMTIGNQILYSVHIAITLGLGLTPGLGIVHNGRSNSFVLDISDIYKAQTSIPIAFDVAYGKDGEAPVERDKIDGEVRKRMRQAIIDNNIIKDSIDKIFFLLNEGVSIEDDEIATIFSRAIWVGEGLWTPDGVLPENVNYSKT